MADTVEIIRKLMALALNNPSEAEAQSAALKAVKLIQRHHIKLGDQPFSTVKATARPEDPDFINLVNEILQGKKADPDHFEPLIIYTDNEVNDDFYRERIKTAWEAIRVERKKLDAIKEALKRRGIRLEDF